MVITNLIKYFLFFQSLFFIFSCSSPEDNANKSNPETAKNPNIIYILADDLGYGDISAYNANTPLNTKNIDRLAENGIMFTDVHTSSSVCTPTRYGILTGRYNWRSELKNGVLSGYSKALINEERLTVGKLLQNNGYHTAFVGKWHLGWDWAMKDTSKAGNIDNLSSRPVVDFSKPVKNGPEARGFSYSYGHSGSLDMPPYVYVENSMPTAIPKDSTQNMDYKGFWRKGLTAPDFEHVDVLPNFTRKSIDYINRQANGDQPFFLYFALPAPHTPILPTTEFMGTSNTNFYGDFMVMVDAMVGRVVDALEENGIREETLIIFTSDNGCSPRAGFDELERAGHDPSYIYRGYKAGIYEGAHRVPFIVSWPEKITQPFKTDETLSTTDFMATAADIVGASLTDDAGEDSYSFLPILMQENYEKPLREATVHHSIEGRFAIRQGKWKLILWPGSGGWSFPRTGEETEGLPEYQLYNLEEDPAEENNLINENPEVAKELKTLLKSYVNKGRSTPGTPQENDGPEQWEQLNWMDEEIINI